MPVSSPFQLERIAQEIIQCRACPRLRKHCSSVARVKKKAYGSQTYWGLPIAGFGDPDAKLLVVGLAPAAHGANRTGRIFTGDRSGDWLYRALYKAGFANQEKSRDLEDGLKLKAAYVSCVARCAPPANKPLPLELNRCAPFLEREILALNQVQVYLALGQIAFNGTWKAVSKLLGEEIQQKPRFYHGARYQISPQRWLLASYHCSQQNTFTGRLTERMFDAIFNEASRLISQSPPSSPPKAGLSIEGEHAI